MTFFRRASLLALVVAPFAAQAQKKVLTQADWDRWRSIQGPTLSNDGKWLAYTLSPQVGDGEFVVRSTTGTTEYRVPLGYISRPNNTPGGERGRGGAPGGGGGGGGRGGGGGGGAGGPFTADGRYAFVTAQPTKAQVEAQQRAGTGRGRAGAGAGGGAANAANQNTVMRVSLADGSITPMREMRTFRLSPTSGKWMIYTPAGDSAASSDSTAGAGRGGAA